MMIWLLRCIVMSIILKHSRITGLNTLLVRGGRKSAAISYQMYGNRFQNFPTFRTSTNIRSGKRTLCYRPFHGCSALYGSKDNDHALFNVNEQNVLNDNEFDVILNDLNEAQIDAVTQPMQAITRVVAGPGAGKTRVLTCRIAYLLKSENLNGNSNKRILAVTFTKKAASEMQHRLDSLLREDEEYQNNRVNSGIQTISGGEDNNDNIIEEVVPSEGRNSHRAAPILSSRVTMGTFHSICAKILRWHGQELEALPIVTKYLPRNANSTLDGSFAIIDQSDQLRLINECLKECNIDLKGGSKNENSIRPVTVLNAIGQLKSDEAMDIMFSKGNDQDFKSAGRKISLKVRKIAEEIYPRYRKALLARNSLDFDDLILMTRDLLRTNKEVRERMQRRWSHILVDEFQDTSEVQLDLVRLLTTSSLLIVGDGDQSIYSWRGAHAESMSDFVKAFNNESEDQRQVNTVYLMENYRSTTNIVKAAQKIISDPSTDQSQEMMRKDMKPMRGKGPSPRVLACADAKAEATFVVKEINKMCDEGTLSPKSTVALIYRTNAQSRALEEACVANNLQYLVRGNVGTFYSRAEIKDCLCFLRWLYNGRDINALSRAIKTPSRGLGDASLNEFMTYCNDAQNQIQSDIATTPLDILISLVNPNSPFISPQGIISKRTMNKLLPFAYQMKEIRKKAETQTVVDLLGTIIDNLNLKSHFDSISKTSDEFADRWANVNELRGAAERYSSRGPCLSENKDDAEDNSLPLGDFLDDVSLLSDSENPDDDPDTGRRLVANLMTIHASKGMEFDCVFLVGNEEGTFPTQRAITEGEGSIELDEERRLCYVAMTRAKTHLVMTWRREVQTFFGENFKYQHPERSRFLDRLVVKKDQRTTKAKVKSKNSDVRIERNQARKSQGSRRLINTSSDINRPVGTKNYALKAQMDLHNPTLAARRDLSKTTRRKQDGERQPLTKRSLAKKTEKQGIPPPTTIDSTLFFPVGCVVRHAIHGQGKVMNPKPVLDDGKMKVTVKFDQSGIELDFPVEASGLIVKHL